MKIERPRICKSCGSFHIVHIRQLEGGEGRSICICLIVCVCICVSVFVFVYVLVYLYLCYCICIVPPRQLGGGKRILRSFSSAAHLQPVRWSGCWSAVDKAPRLIIRIVIWILPSDTVLQYLSTQ